MQLQLLQGYSEKNMFALKQWELKMDKNPMDCGLVSVIYSVSHSNRHNPDPGTPDFSTAVTVLLSNNRFRFSFRIIDL